MRELNETDYPGVRRALEELSSAMTSEEAPARVESRLLEAYRARHARGRRRRWMWAGGAAAIAAAGLLAALVPFWTRIEKLPPARIVHAPPARIETAPAKHAPAAATRRRRPAAPRRIEPPARLEVATDFFPLGPGPVVEAGESASLVRVSVPRSEMRRFGLFSGFDTAGAVQADVVIGQDGMARAVRFVSSSQRLWTIQ
jgi:hypothetical protein